MSYRNDLYNPFFSHIYVEKDILNCDETQEILNRFKGSRVIVIDKYLDIFGRSHQSFIEQHQSQKLIIAKQHGSQVYRGSRNCQSFNHDYFYYTSNMMNCIYDCEYCYLKGMYPSGNIVYFINTEDTFNEIEEKLERHPVYVSISYNTDLMAVENVFNIVHKWEGLVEKHDDLCVEVRTKCGNIHAWDNLKANKNMVYAFTISPNEVISRFERGTSNFEQRITCAKELIQKGYSVRLCFDPMIYCKNWEEAYSNMLKKCNEEIDLNSVVDFSVGSFRISQDYMKNMRKMEPNSQIAWFPYENSNGVYQYPNSLQQRMHNFLLEELLKYTDESKIFCWEA